MGIKMKGLRKVLTGALALTMCLGAALTTMAGTGGSPQAQAEARLTKTVSKAAGLEIPATTFTFDFAKESLNGRDGGDFLAKMPDIASEQIMFDAGDSVLTKESRNLVAGLDWTLGGAGTYVWTVTENQVADPLDGGRSWSYSQASFHLVVKVAYDATDGYYVEQTHTRKTGDDATGSIQGGKAGAEPGDTDYNFTFTNIFSKEAGERPGTGEGNEALVISKVVENSVDVNKDFSFTLELDDTVAKHIRGKYTGTVTDDSGVPIVPEVTYDVTAGTPATFTLKEGQKLVFHDVPIGTVVNVTEQGNVGYTPAITGMVEVSTGADGGSLSTGDVAMGEQDNEVIFTNTYTTGSIDTGVFANNLPFIALIAAGILAVGLFAVINKRKAMR